MHFRYIRVEENIGFLEEHFPGLRAGGSIVSLTAVGRGVRGTVRRPLLVRGISGWTPLSDEDRVRNLLTSRKEAYMVVLVEAQPPWPRTILQTVRAGGSLGYAN